MARFLSTDLKALLDAQPPRSAAVMCAKPHREAEIAVIPGACAIPLESPCERSGEAVEEPAPARR